MEAVETHLISLLLVMVFDDHITYTLTDPLALIVYAVGLTDSYLFLNPIHCNQYKYSISGEE